MTTPWSSSRETFNSHPPLTPRASSSPHRRALLCAPTVDALRRGRVWASTLRRGRCAVEIALCDAIWYGAFGNTQGRTVLVRDPGGDRVLAIFTTDTTSDAQTIVAPVHPPLAVMAISP